MITALITAILARRYWLFLILLLSHGIAFTVLAMPLHDAARSGKLSEVRAILEQGGNINGLTLYGFTPLLLAKLNDHEQTSQLLEKSGARTELDQLVKRIQFYFQLLGYEVGAVDGLLGPGTRAAIRKYQTAEQFEVTGRVYEAWVISLHRNVWKKIQQALRSQGIEPGPIDGLMGPGLRKAIRSYQQQLGVAVTGRISADWVEPLLAGASTASASSVNEADAPADDATTVAAPATTTTTASTPVAEVTTLTNDKATMRQIQARLQELGFYSGPLDGELGPATEDAIRAFQRQAGLEVSVQITPQWVSQLDKAVLRSLRSRLEVMGYDDKVYLDFRHLNGEAEPAATPELPFREDGQEQDSDASLNQAPTMVAAEPLDEDRLRTVQSHLKTLGYYSGGVDGLVGEQSKQAILVFQKKAGLAQTAQADVELLRQLEQAVAVLEAQEAEQQAQIKALKSAQEKLQVLGFDPGEIDGQMGSKTTKAIASFQKQHKLPAISGELGLRVINEQLDKEIVRLVQTQLQTLSFQPGAVDGHKGQRTEAAIRAYQTRYKLKVDGEASVALARALKQRIAAREASERAKQRAQLAKEVQSELKALGFKVGAIDGEIGSSSQRAIRSFQRQQGIKITGEISESLLKSLREASKQAQAEAEQKKAQAAATMPVEPAESAPVKATSDAIIVWQSPGKTGGVPPLTVAKIQKRLNELGYNAGPADGILGTGTKSAIEAFQRRMGDPVTGSPNETLLKKLQSKSAKRAPTRLALTQKPSSKLVGAKRTKRGNTEVRGKLRFQRADNGTLIGCSIKGLQLDRAWCSPFTARRNTRDCKAIIRPNSEVLLVKCG